MSARGLIVGLAAGAGALAVMRSVLPVAAPLQSDGSDFDFTLEPGADDVPMTGDAPSALDQIMNTVTNAFTSPTALSDAGLAQLSRFEGFSPVSYPDHKGRSIGYGHLIQPGESFTRIDEAQGREILRADVAIAERAVSAAVSASLTQAQFDALVSLAFNIGAGAFKRSTLVRLLNAGDYAGAQAQFARWNMASGAVNDALVARRATEAEMFGGLA